jgi:hypothetical protein
LLETLLNTPFLDFGSVDRLPHLLAVDAPELRRNILELPPGVTAQRLLLDPNYNTDAFVSGLLSMRNRRPIDWEALGTEQTSYFRQVENSLGKATIFVLNSESVSESGPVLQSFAPVGGFRQLFVVCSGLKPFLLWAKAGAPDADIIFYDKFDGNLAFWNCLLREWDGYDYECFLGEYDDQMFTSGNYCVGHGPVEATRKAIFQSNLVKSLAVFGSETEFARHWRAFQRLSHTFLKCDLLFEAHGLIDKVTSDAVLFWFSNIFRYHLTIRAFGTRLIRESYIRMVKDLREYHSHIFCLGEQPLPCRPGHKICCRAEDIDLTPLVG